MKYCVLFNPKSGSGSAAKDSHKLDELYGAENITYCDMLRVRETGYEEFFAALPDDTDVIVSGGDGTLSRFVNDTQNIEYNRKIYYYAAGSGNDFLRDLGFGKGQPPFEITEYIKSLPAVHVNGKDVLFINGVGCGIDGYCCDEGERIRAKTGKPINYTMIALKGLIYAFRPADAVVTVDGVSKKYSRVWLAPTMQGRFYGGGMMVAPDQKRTNPEGTVTVMVAHDLSNFMITVLFPSIFKGKHPRFKKHVDMFCGHEVSVKFDAEYALQIDGDTYPATTGYSVSAGRREPAAMSEK